MNLSMNPSRAGAPLSRSRLLALAATLLLTLVACAVPPAAAPSPDSTAAAPVELDRSCRSDADCAVKNVGNCCGYYPSCVNVDSPTDPDGVRAACKESGTAGVCGFPAIDSCQCVRDRCEGSSRIAAD